MILVVGALHWDAIVEAPRLPREDETLPGGPARHAFGGKGGNQAVAAARMGAAVAMAGRVGEDDAGARLLEGLAAAGVDAGQVRRVPGVSGLSVAIALPGGGYGAVTAPGVNREIDADAVVLPAGLRWLLLQNEIPAAVNAALAGRAKAAGARVLLNAAPARPLSPALRGAVDLLVVNRVEAADMLGADRPPAQAAAALAGDGAAIVTLGADGLVLHDGRATPLPPHRVAARSAHGAGDVFVGALAAALAAGPHGGAALVEAARFAQAAAALHVGADPADRSGVTPSAARALAAQSR